MKKSAFLAVSALSLGVVGLAGFAPVINAATPSSTSTATVSVTVEGGLGLGTSEENAQVGNVANSALDVNLGTISNNAVSADQKKTVAVTNNTTSGVTVTLQDNDTDTSLKNGANAIPTGTDITAGKSAWGVKIAGDSSFRAMPSSTGTAITVIDTNATGTQTKDVTYKVSTNASQAPGNYSDVVKYTASAKQ